MLEVGKTYQRAAREGTHHVVFNGAPSLHTAAHEAAHVVQQQSGVKLSGGIGTSAPVQRKFLDDKGAVMSDLDVDTEAAKHGHM